MLKNTKIARAQDFIEEMFLTDRPALEKVFLEKNADITPATYYDAWKTVQAKYARNPKFLVWSEGVRLGRIGPSNQKCVWDYLELRLAKNLPVQRHEFLQKNPEISIKSFDSSLLRWLKTKRQHKDHNFESWDLTVRLCGSQKGRVRAHLEHCFMTRELVQLQLFLSENSDIKAERVRAALKEFKRDHHGDVKFSEWWAMNNQHPTTNKHSKSTREKDFNKNQQTITAGPIQVETIAYPQIIKTENAVQLSTENSELVRVSKETINSHQYNPAKFPLGIRVSKKERALNYIKKKYFKNEIATFVDFVSKNPDISSGTYSNALKSIQAEYKNDQTFTGWFDRCANFIKENTKKNPSTAKGSALQKEVVEFIKKQYASDGNISFEAYLIDHPNARISTFGLGRLKFRRIYANNPKIIEWLDNQMQTKDKILRIKEYLSKKFPNYERLNWDEFLKKNPDISAETIPESRLLWLKEQKKSRGEAQDWLQSNMILERAFIIGQVFEKAILITLYPALREKGIQWYYNTKNFAFSKETKKNVEGRLFVEDLRKIGDKIGPDFQKFLDLCGREEIAIDFTISSEVWPKFQKYPDQRTALLVITVNNRLQHQPIEKHIRIIPLEEFMGSGWLNLPPEIQLEIQKIVNDERDAIRQGLDSTAFLRLKNILKEQWTKISHEMNTQGSQGQYTTRVLNIIQHAVQNGNLTHQLQTYLEALRNRGQNNYADFLDGVAKDRARRKVVRSNLDEKNDSCQAIDERIMESPKDIDKINEKYIKLLQQDAYNEKNSICKEQTESVSPDPSIFTENNSKSKEVGTVRKGSANTQKDIWTQCTAMFPDRRRQILLRCIEEELAWEEYQRQAASTPGRKETLLWNNIPHTEAIPVENQSKKLPRNVISPPRKTIDAQSTDSFTNKIKLQKEGLLLETPKDKISKHSDPPIQDQRDGDPVPVPVPEDASVEYFRQNKEVTIDQDTKTGDNDEEVSNDDDQTDPEENNPPKSESPGDKCEEKHPSDAGKSPTNSQMIAEKPPLETAQEEKSPPIDVTSEGGCLVFEGGPGAPLVPDGGNNGQDGNRKGCEDKSKMSVNGESIASFTKKFSPTLQRTDTSTTPIPGDGKVQVTGNDLQSIKNAAAYKEGALIVDQHGKGVFLSAADTKGIRDALDHVQASLKHAREDACGPDPDTQIKPDGSDVTGDAKRGTPITGEDVKAIRDSGHYGGGVLIHGDKGGLFLNEQDVKAINSALDHVQSSLKNARNDTCGPDPDTRIRPDGSDATGDARNGMLVTGDDVKAIREAGLHGGGVLIHGDKGGLFLNGKDVKEINEALNHVRAEIDKARPADAGQTMDAPVTNAQDCTNANPPNDPYPIHDPRVTDGQTRVTPEDLRDIRAAGRGEVAGDAVIKTDTGRKVFPRDVAERINNTLDRVGIKLSKLEWKLATSERGYHLSTRNQVDHSSRDRGQDPARENHHEDPRPPLKPDAGPQSTGPLPDKPGGPALPADREHAQIQADPLAAKSYSNDHEPGAISPPDVSHEVKKPATRERSKAPAGAAEGDLCGRFVRKGGDLYADGQKITLESSEWRTDPPRVPDDKGTELPAPKHPPDKASPGGDGPCREEPNGDETNVPRPDPTPENPGQENSSNPLPIDEGDKAPESEDDPDLPLPGEEEDEWAGWNSESGQESGADNSEGGEDRDQDIPEEDDDNEWAGWNPESGQDSGEEGTDPGEDPEGDGEEDHDQGSDPPEGCPDRGERGSYL